MGKNDDISNVLLDDPRTMGNRIRIAFESAGMNQNQFARAIGGTWSNVYRWVKGESLPSLESYVRIAIVTGRSLDWLVFGQERRSVPVPCQELQRWLVEQAPSDLSPQERRELASMAFEAPHPGESTYTLALCGIRTNRSRHARWLEPRRH